VAHTSYRGQSPPEAKSNVKSVYNLTFPIRNLGFNEYMGAPGADLGQYIVHTIQKHSEDSMGEV